MALTTDVYDESLGSQLHGGDDGDDYVMCGESLDSWVSGPDDDGSNHCRTTDLGTLGLGCSDRGRMCPTPGFLSRPGRVTVVVT